MKTVRALWRDKVAATSIEYALIAFFVSISLIAGATTIGTKLNAKLSPIAANLS